MPRLIDADVLRSVFTEKSSERVCGIKLCKAIIYRIDHTPTVDAVPVIRCKHCGHRYLDKKYGFRCDLDSGNPYEETRNADNPEWYCADGGRKDA